jgi:hypothetical protein
MAPNVELKTALVTLDTTEPSFQSSEFVPTLARFKFALKATCSVKETLAKEHDTSADQADATLLPLPQMQHQGLH